MLQLCPLLYVRPPSPDAMCGQHDILAASVAGRDFSGPDLGGADHFRRLRRLGHNFRRSSSLDTPRQFRPDARAFDVRDHRLFGLITADEKVPRSTRGPAGQELPPPSCRHSLVPHVACLLSVVCASSVFLSLPWRSPDIGASGK